MINIDVDVNPPGALREQIAQSKSNWFRGSWIADYPDAENYLSLFYSDNFCPKGPNYTHYSNAKFDKLYSQAKATISYTYQNKQRNYNNPEEKVQAETFLRLIIDYKYPDINLLEPLAQALNVNLI